MKNIRLILALLLITAPINIFFFTWLVSTAETYSAYKYDFRSAAPRDKLLNTGEFYYKYLLNRVFSSDDIFFADVNLIVKKEKLRELNSHLPESGFDYQSAYMFGDNVSGVQKVKVRFRGDNAKHWIFPYKSWRVKTSKNELYSKARKINFINPSSNHLLSNHAGYLLAKQVGLLAPDSSLVSLSVNGKNQGVRLFVEQLDESFLRKNARMPNDIYKGENVGADHVFGVPVKIWNGSYMWQKAAHNNHYDEANKKPLDTLLSDMFRHDFDILSINDFALFSVFMSLTNSYHYDGVHNWRLSYDGYLEKFYPVVWDPRGWWKDFFRFSGVDIFRTELMQLLAQDYRFLQSRQEQFYSFYENDYDEFVDRMDSVVADAVKKAKNIPLSLNAHSTVKGSDETISDILEFQNTIVNHLDSVKREVFLYDTNDYKYALLPDGLRLSIAGRQLVNNVYLGLGSGADVQKVMLSFDVDGKITTLDISHRADFIDDKLILRVPLLSYISRTTNTKKLDFDPVTYDITMIGSSPFVVESVALELLTPGKPQIKVGNIDFITAKSFHNVYNVLENVVVHGTQTWSGLKYINGFNLIEDDVVIEPGTRIIFGEGATLKLLGKVTAIGDADSPIYFEAKDNTKPWNSLALKDDRANGSIFKNCVFKDGSGDKGDLHEYTAMFSVHNVKDLVVDSCEFYNSHRTDDMVHVIYSDVVFKNSKFVNSLSDALDVDISNVVVDGCEFVDSGNDAIDLMTTSAIIVNSKFINSSDKGVSIGEGSRLLAINNYIQGNGIGMQSKDTSRAFIYNTSFVNNATAVDAYHKNWRYSEGGTITLDKVSFKDNVVGVTVGKKSKIIVNDSDRLGGANAKDIKNRKLVFSDEAYMPYGFNDDFFVDRASLINKDVRGYVE